MSGRYRALEYKNGIPVRAHVNAWMHIDLVRLLLSQYAQQECDHLTRYCTEDLGLLAAHVNTAKVTFRV